MPPALCSLQPAISSCQSANPWRDLCCPQVSRQAVAHLRPLYRQSPTPLMPAELRVGISESLGKATCGISSTFETRFATKEPNISTLPRAELSMLPFQCHTQGEATESPGNVLKVLLCQAGIRPCSSGRKTCALCTQPLGVAVTRATSRTLRLKTLRACFPQWIHPGPSPQFCGNVARISNHTPM